MSDLVHLLPPMPDLGPPRAVPDPSDPGGYRCNVAMTVALARHEPTPQSAAFYRAFVRRWDEVQFAAGSTDERQGLAIQRACDDVGFRGLAREQRT